MSQAANARGRPLPKFGEWDVNNPASAEGFTVIFNKARNQKKTNGTAVGGGGMGDPQHLDQNNNNHANHHHHKHDHHYHKQNLDHQPSGPKRWLCCFVAR